MTNTEAKQRGYVDCFFHSEKYQGVCLILCLSEVESESDSGRDTLFHNS